MINKKGALFHWIIFGVLAALGLFFFFIQDTNVGLNVKGAWHIAFLNDYVLSGEKELLAVDQIAQAMAQEVALDLAQNGGFLDSASSSEDHSCGKEKGVNFWNKNSKFCFPDVRGNLQREFNRKFGERKNFNYTLTVEGKELVGKTDSVIEISRRSILKEEALEKLTPEEKSCLLQKGMVPMFGIMGSFSDCNTCPNSGCSNYINRFYCDLDPCNLGCVSYYRDNNKNYNHCGECPAEKSCDKYFNEYYCQLDPCGYGCIWDVSRCKEGTIAERSWKNDSLEKITIVTFPESFNEYNSYTVSPNFRVNLGYSFDEYEILKAESAVLVSQCSKEKDFKNCLEKVKPVHWKFSNCDKESFMEDNRKVIFCVESINGANISAVPVRYRIGLDFTPSEGLTMEEVTVTFNSVSGMFEVSFPQDKTADSYKIYYTDYLQLEGQTGLAADIFNQVPLTLGYTVAAWEILPEKLTAGCSFTESKNAYLCQDKVVYVLDKNSLATISQGYLFGVTAIKESKESAIKSLISVKE